MSDYDTPKGRTIDETIEVLNREWEDELYDEKHDVQFELRVQRWNTGKMRLVVEPEDSADVRKEIGLVYRDEDKFAAYLEGLEDAAKISYKAEYPQSLIDNVNEPDPNDNDSE